MKRALLLLVAVSLAGGLAWVFRPLDPEAWRALAAEADDAALAAQLVWSGFEGRVVEERWRHFLAAVGQGDATALELARRVCPKADTHPGEELLDALAVHLEARPELAFKAISQCVRPRVLCSAPDQPRDVARRQQEAVRAVLDGGWSREAAECLEALSPRPARKWAPPEAPPTE